MDYETTDIRKVKRPEGIGRWLAYVVGNDSFGIWLYSLKGTIYRGQVGMESSECEVGQGNRPAGHPVMHLIPRHKWWITFWGRDHINVDICTPPSLVEKEWTYVDLELDPVLFRDGRVQIDDVDEFDAACRSGLIPLEEQKHAQAAVAEVEQQMRLHWEPFGKIGWAKLAATVGLSLPPISDLTHISLELNRE